MSGNPIARQIARFNLKIIGGILFIMALALPLIISSIYSLWRVTHIQDEFIATQAQEFRLAQELRIYMKQQQATMPVYVLTGDAELLKQNDHASETFKGTLEQLYKIVEDPTVHRILDEIRDQHERLTQLRLPGIKMRQAGASAAQVNEYFSKVPAVEAAKLVDAIQNLANHAEIAFETAKTENLKTSKKAIKILGVATSIAVFLFIMVGALLIQFIRQKQAFDLSQEQLLRKEMQLSKARKEAVEVVAHDLKNPLASIVMSTEMALSQDELKLTPDEFKMSLEITLRSARSMLRMIEELLDNTKIESGSLVMKKSRCDATVLLHESLQQVESIAESRGIQLQLSCPRQLPMMSLDAARIEQVLSNFLGNALKFTPAGGTVVLSASVQRDGVKVSVTDSGPGMTKEQAAHVFERYWQARETANQGTGLGLSIAQAIVHAHNGKIWVESSPGKGSEFSFLLPFTDSVVSTPTKSLELSL